MPKNSKVTQREHSSEHVTESVADLLALEEPVTECPERGRRGRWQAEGGGGGAGCGGQAGLEQQAAVHSGPDRLLRGPRQHLEVPLPVPEKWRR